MADDVKQVNFEFPDNTGPITQSFSNLGAITKQMREDMKAIGDEMGSISDRADRLREFWQSNLELVQNMKSVLEIITSITQSNQSMLQSIRNPIIPIILIDLQMAKGLFAEISLTILILKFIVFYSKGHALEKHYYASQYVQEWKACAE